MNKELYTQIFKRKSFHLFREKSNESITSEEIEDIKKAFYDFEALDKDIKVDLKIVEAEETTCKRGEDYCILLFSEKKNDYLRNIGYIGEQLDLYLVSKNIGSLWFGIAKSNEVYNGLDYVIMIAIAKCDESKFRKDMYKSKRKDIMDIWEGNDLNISNIVRFAPSACNSQPWFVENKDNKLVVYRKSKSGKVGIMPKNAAVYYNQIDIGIFMCFLELCLMKENITFIREQFTDTQQFEKPVKIAEYCYNEGII